MPVPTPTLAAFGMQEWIIVLLIALLLFGASRLPGIARSLGRSVGEFKQGLKDDPNQKGSSPPTPDASNKN